VKGGRVGYRGTFHAPACGRLRGPDAARPVAISSDSMLIALPPADAADQDAGLERQAAGVDAPRRVTLPMLEGKNKMKQRALKDNKVTLRRSDTLSRIESEIPRLRNYARFLSRDMDLADDLLQDCLVHAIEKLESWQPGTNLGAWLFTILRNLHVSEIRRHRRISPVAVDDLPEHAVPAVHETRIYCRQVWQATNALAPEYRQVFSLVVADELTYKQAAVALDVEIGTVRSRLSRARACLQRSLRDGSASQESLR
jgi:RNA polymerase sigma-70 factor, ECF subfamily